MSPPRRPSGPAAAPRPRCASRSPRETPATPGCSGRPGAARSRAGGEPCLVWLPRWIRVENKMDFELLSLSAAEPARPGLLSTRCVLGWFLGRWCAVVRLRCFDTAIPPPPFQGNEGDLNPTDSQFWLCAVSPGFFSKSHLGILKILG